MIPGVCIQPLQGCKYIVFANTPVPGVLCVLNPSGVAVGCMHVSGINSFVYLGSLIHYIIPHLMKHITLFLCMVMAVQISAQFAPKHTHTQAVESLGKLSQKLSALTSGYDYKRYEFRWGLISMAWDSTTFADAFALEENGQLNFYIYESRYDMFGQSFLPREYIVLYNVNTELGSNPELFEDEGTFGYFADSLVIYQYDEDLGGYFPALIGYLTQHTGNLLKSFDVYLNAGGTTEPPYDLLLFLRFDIRYDAQDRPETAIFTSLDFFGSGDDPVYDIDSFLYVYNSADQVTQVTAYSNDELWYIEHTTYPGGAGTLSSVAVTTYYDLTVVASKDSVVTMYPNATNYVLRSYTSAGGALPYQWNYQETFMMFDTVSLLTSFSVNQGPPVPFYQARRSYDELGRISRILELSDFPFDTLSNDRLTIFEYAQSSSVTGVSPALSGFSHYLSGRELIVEFETPFEGEITLFTATGQSVTRARISGTQASVLLPSVPSGIYFGFVQGRDMRGGFGFRYLAE